MIARFHNPVDTRFGWGSLHQLADITEHQTVALVTFPEARGLGLVDRIQDLLGDRLVYVIEDVQPNPDVAQLRDTYERFWQEAGNIIRCTSSALSCPPESLVAMIHG